MPKLAGRKLGVMIDNGGETMIKVPDSRREQGADIDQAVHPNSGMQVFGKVDDWEMFNIKGNNEYVINDMGLWSASREEAGNREWSCRENHQVRREVVQQTEKTSWNRIKNH